VLILPSLVGHAVALFEVAARAKCPVTRTGHHNAPVLRRRRVDLVEEGEQVTPHLGVHRVGGVGPVERQEQQPLAAILDPRHLVFAIHLSVSDRVLP
jgi:hypothetical protein